MFAVWMKLSKNFTRSMSAELWSVQGLKELLVSYCEGKWPGKGVVAH